MQLCPLLDSTSEVNLPIYAVFALEATFLCEYKNSLNPCCYHDSLRLLIRGDRFNRLVIFNNAEVNTVLNLGSSQAYLRFYFGALLSGGQRG